MNPYMLERIAKARTEELTGQRHRTRSDPDRHRTRTRRPLRRNVGWMMVDFGLRLSLAEPR